MKTNLIKAALFTPLSFNRWGLTLLNWAEPGCAKTALIEEICATYGLPCETLSPSERGEGAFGVVPVPSGEGANMVLNYPRPEWTQKFDVKKRGVCFIDEATSTPPALQAPLMGLILAGRIGGYTLPPGVRRMAAANPSDIAAGGFDIAAPVANRMGHIDWTTPSVEEHNAYMMRGTTGSGASAGDEFSAEAEERRVLAGWGEAWARAVGLEGAFLQRRPGLKNQCPKAGDPKASRAWASDRTWEMATRALASAALHSLTEVETEEFVGAFIGEGTAGEWFTFMKEQDMPDPADVLDGRVEFKHNKSRLDRTVAVLGACVTLVAPPAAAKRAARSSALWGLLEHMTDSKADLDLLVPPVHALIEADLHSLKDAAKTLAKVQPVLKAAGITPKRSR